MKILSLNFKALFSISLIVFAMLLWSCNKSGGDNPPIDPIDENIVLEITQSVSAIAVGADNTKWIGTSVGLFKSVSGGYHLVDTIGEIAVNTLLLEAESNVLWVGTVEGLFKVKLSGSEIVDYSIIATDKLSHSNIKSFCKDGASKNWFGSEVGITLNYDDYWKKDSFRINALGRIFPLIFEAMEVNSIAIWDGDYYFATTGGGLYRAVEYNEEVDAFSGATQWESPYNGPNITSNMNVVFVDSQGRKWMGGESGIQVHIGHDPSDISNLGVFNDELLSNHIQTIVEAPDGKIWVGTDLGISIYDGVSWSSVTENLPDLNVLSIAFDTLDGSVWIGTLKGLVNVKLVVA